MNNVTFALVFCIQMIFVIQVHSEKTDHKTYFTTKLKMANLGQKATTCMLLQQKPHGIQPECYFFELIFIFIEHIKYYKNSEQRVPFSWSIKQELKTCHFKMKHLHNSNKSIFYVKLQDQKYFLVGRLDLLRLFEPTAGVSIFNNVYG